MTRPWVLYGEGYGFSIHSISPSRSVATSRGIRENANVFESRERCAPAGGAGRESADRRLCHKLMPQACAHVFARCV